MYDLLGVKFKTDKKSGKVTLAQGGLNKKLMKTVGILDSNKNTTTAEKTHLEQMLMNLCLMNIGIMPLLLKC